MTDLQQRIASLSPQERALFERRLMERLAAPGAPAIPRRTQPGPIPLSFAQDRLWFLDQLYPGQPTYNEPSAYRFLGALDVAALQQALTALVERHEVLRTTFHMVDGTPRQVVDSPRSVPLPLIAVDDTRDPLAAAQAQFPVLIDAPFDLARDLMLRVTLFRLGESDHVLLMVNHHIASDAWSARPRLAELAEFYTAYAEGRTPHLAPLTIQYADYAVWQRAWLQGDRLQRQMAYWRTQLAGLQPLVLPTAYPHPAMFTQRGDDVQFMLPRDLAERLRELARTQNATLYMVLLAAFALILARYTGQDDIAVGTPTANRRHAEVESLIGFFVNTLVMRVDLTGNPTFRSLLDRVRQVALAAYDHQDIPFEKVVEELRPERRLHHTPLVSTVFQVHNLTPEQITLPNLTVTRLDVPDGHAKVELDCALIQQPDGIHGRWRYATDLFDRGAIARMVAHYQTLLESIVADPDCPIDRLPVLTVTERQQILVDWNQTHADFPADQCIHDLVAAQAARTPAAVAVVCGEERLTYAELNDRADRLAVRLQQMGAGADHLVALYMTRSAAMIVAMLAVLKAGAAYVPLDPAHPAQRTALILEDASVAFLLTQRPLRDTLPPTTATIVCLDDLATVDQPHGAPRPLARAGNLAYLIYTSGSTGRPKGVAVEHRSVVNLLAAHQFRLLVDSNDVWLTLATLTFDIATLEIFLPLVVGAQVVVAREEEIKDPWRLQALIDSADATVMLATPSAWRMLLDAGWPGKSSLRLLTGGESLSPRLADALLARGKELWNLYGPTETTIFSTLYAVRAGEVSPPIGRPVANTQVYVLDGSGQPAPVGVPGELYIGGVGVARGYFRRPELTTERFVPNPFTPQISARLYRTGDLVRWRADGVLEYLGRNDHQVKVRGHRIELGEIEAALARHPTVQHAVVVARPDTAGAHQLVAYCIPRPDANLASADIMQFLRAMLPEHMIPAACVELAAWPLTPNGKLDRAALPDPTGGIVLRSVTHTPPRSPLERTIANIWATLLGVKEIGVHDNFFDLGGHSLLATQVISRLRRQFQIDLTLRALFEAPTVAGIAAVIAALIAAPTSATPSITPLATSAKTAAALEEFLL